MSIQNTSNKKIILISSIFAAIICGSFGYLLYKSYNDSTQNEIIQKKKTPPPPKVTQKNKIEKDRPQNDKIFQTDSIPIAGSLGKITELRAELDETKLQVAILQEKEKLMPKQSKSPTPIVHPSIQLPPIEPIKLNSVPTNSPVILSIQSLEGIASATVKLNNQIVTLRPGDRFNGGIVSTIKRDGILLKKNNKISVIRLN
jgi:hypothetical protein